MWHKEKIALIGASGGLGSAFAKILDAKTQELTFFLCSRNLQKNQTLASELKVQTEIIEFDASKEAQADSLLNQFDEIKPQRLFYFSGGGPFGEFQTKNWRDHLWAFQVTYLTPAKFLHHFLKQDYLKQFIFVGSLVAENQAHPFGASYAAAKSAMLTLIGSVNAEKHSNIDVRVFSPDYINTDMLPKNAYPRRMNLPILEPDLAAQKLFDWSIEPKASWHYQLKATT